MEVLGIQSVTGRTVGFFGIEGVEKSVQVLHVRDVTAESDNRGVRERSKALYISESSKRAIGSC